MPMGRAPTRTVGNPVPHSSRAKTKGRRMLGMAIHTLFLQDQSVGKSDFVSHTKHTIEATNMDLFHS